MRLAIVLLSLLSLLLASALWRVIANSSMREDALFKLATDFCLEQSEQSRDRQQLGIRPDPRHDQAGSERWDRIMNEDYHNRRTCMDRVVQASIVHP